MSSHPTVARGSRGERWRLEAGPYNAEISSVGATLEALTVNERDLVVRSADHGPVQFFRGAVLAPWPNRIEGGSYTWDELEIQAPLNEPERGHAIHGTVYLHPFTATQHTTSALTLELEQFPSTGYPFHLKFTVTYELDASTGLSLTITAHNVGDVDAPYGVCPHPYLIAGPEPLNEWSMQFGAGSVCVVDESLIPTRLDAVGPGTQFDFAHARVVGELEIDHAFTDLERDESGNFAVTITAPGGTGVEMTTGIECPWMQIHTGDRPEPEHDRLGMAVEPMTCPPNAFRTGTDVVRLQPGHSHHAHWQIRGW